MAYNFHSKLPTSSLVQYLASYAAKNSPPRGSGPVANAASLQLCPIHHQGCEQIVKVYATTL